MTRGPSGPPASALELRSRIPRYGNGLPLLDYLLQRFRYLDRQAWLAEFAAGRILLDGVTARPEQLLRAGAELLYRKEHREPQV